MTAALRSRVLRPDSWSVGDASAGRLIAGTTADSRVVAAIDIGSTSVHLLVAGWTWRMLVPLVDQSVDLGLGRHVDRDGQLGPRRRARVVQAVARYVERARLHGAEQIAIVGTEPLRHASDTPELTVELQMATGVRTQVLDHAMEGRLGLLGALRGATASRAVGIVDIGGGSSEVAVARPDGRTSVDGVRIGALRLTQAVAPGDPPSWADVVALRAVARDAVQKVQPQADVSFTAIGGTARALLRLAAGRARPGVLGRDDLEWLTGALVRRPSGRIAARHGLRAERARLLPAGTAILFALMERLGLEAVEVSQAGLREGLAIAMVRHGADWRTAADDGAEPDADPGPDGDAGVGGPAGSAATTVDAATWRCSPRRRTPP